MASESTRRVSNWGRFPSHRAAVWSIHTVQEIQDVLSRVPNAIARGLGRCYGDSSLGSNIMDITSLQDIYSFDTEHGIIECGAGLSIKELIEISVPAGWFPSVVPGTKYVTIGGAIASDIHGKNHHRDGSFSRYVEQIDLVRGADRVLACDRVENSELFKATCGGMGLTGIIVKTRIRLRQIQSPYLLRQQTLFSTLQEAASLFETHMGAEYSVAWLDLSNSRPGHVRGIYLEGRHAEASDCEGVALPEIRREWSCPAAFGLFLNPVTSRLFDQLYYRCGRRQTKPGLVDFDSFFFPLDRIRDWSKLYGSQGMIQYQFVLPKPESIRGIHQILSRVQESSFHSYLTVMKLLREEHGYLSFPMEGYTVSMDFANSTGLREFLNKLDEDVVELGGRIYLAKDARMSPKTFREGYPRSEEFEAFMISKSLQSERLGLCQTL